MRENLRNRIAKMPMAMVIIPFALGIFFADIAELPLWSLFLAGFVSLVGVVVLERWWQNFALFVLIFMTGSLLHSISYSGEIEYDKPYEMELKVDSSSVKRDGYTSAQAKIERCQNPNFVNRKVVLWGDSLTTFKAGDRLHITTSVRPFKAKHEQYARLMHHRGFVGSVSVNSSSTYGYLPTERETMHDWAVGRLRGAMSEGDSRAIVLAMVTGERGEISEELRQNYSASGASHLLAVSGLHIGIAFILINLLLLPLVLVRYGNILRSFLAIASIWAYVWLCGSSPSAIRAAIMFSVLQLSLASLREYVSVNVLATTAFVMLAFDTHLLFDISFQLSFIAVAGIILWAVPLYRLCVTRFKIVNAVVAILLVGFSSTLITMPLVANAFSIISLVGILINPVVILLAHIVVLSGIVALAIPIIAPVAEFTALLQNRIVAWAMALPYSHFEVTISSAMMWGMYALFAVATILIWVLSDYKRAKKVK